MNTLLFQYALEVEKTGSITKAAQNLYMNQPHLSKAIRELEHQFHIEIFHRTPKGMIPTEKGKEFLSYARQMVATLSKIEAISRHTADEKSLSFCCTDEVHLIFSLSKWIQHLSPSEFSFDITLFPGAPFSVIDAVWRREYQTGVLCYPASREPFIQDLLKEKGLSAVPIGSRNQYLISSNRIADIDRSFLSHSSYIDTGVPQERSVSKNILHSGIMEAFLLIKENPSFYTLSPPVPQEILELYSLRQHFYQETFYREIGIFLQGSPISNEIKELFAALKKL